MITKDLFLSQLDLSENQLHSMVAEALHKADDGELFLEAKQSLDLALDDGKVKSTSFNDVAGMGLRRIDGDFAGLVHSNQLTTFQLKKSVRDVLNMAKGESEMRVLDGRSPHAAPLYKALNPVEEHSVADRVALLQEIDAYARTKYKNVKQVIARFHTEMQQVMIVRADGQLQTDVRPLIRLDVQLMLNNGQRQEMGHFGFGGRESEQLFFTKANWQNAVEQAYSQAEVNLESIPAPAGEMPVVMASGWSGVLFHEAVGHGLEGDFNRKGTSTFSGRIGEQVASKGVTVVDDGSIANRRGSLTIDDEGTPTGRTTLIEDGVLKGYMQDRLNARLMGTSLTGNGRRESYAHLPIPRMTNTFMLAGQEDPEDIVKDTKKGIYAKSFGGGQVDITSGNYVFEVNEAYLIENGQLGAPVKGATLIGNGPESMQRIDRIGHDEKLDNGIGTCGKDGQGVPVGVGMPTIRLSAITVGGTG